MTEKKMAKIVFVVLLYVYDGHEEYYIYRKRMFWIAVCTHCNSKEMYYYLHSDVACSEIHRISSYQVSENIFHILTYL